MKKYLEAEYLNLDLLFESADDLTPLLEYFGDNILVLYNEKTDYIYQLGIECLDCPDTADAHTEHLLALLESTPDNMKHLLTGCESIVFDYGFRGGLEPDRISIDISKRDIQRIENFGASIRVSIYSSAEAPNHAIKADEK